MEQKIDRRRFLKGALAAGLVIYSTKLAAFERSVGFKSKLKIGFIADLHHDVVGDGEQRLHAFLGAMKKAKPDALIQLGDFAYPGDINKNVIDAFNQAHPIALHVIGNHDTDNGFKKEQCVSYWGMPAPYYTRQIGDIKFIILDGNEKGSPTRKSGYAAYIGDAQAQWLAQELTKATGKVVVICHQPIAGAMEIDNAVQIRSILNKASDKILIVINGHTHLDYTLKVDDIDYLHLNSASYFWGGGKYKHDSYSKAVHEKHPYLCYTFPYRDALYSLMTFDFKTGKITVKGVKSEWMGQSPAEMNYTDMLPIAPDKEIKPSISDYVI